MAEKHRIEFCNGNVYPLESGNDLIFIEVVKAKITWDNTSITWDSTIVTLDNQ